jgi:thiamine-phosphate pyrophosphorylase
LLLYYITGGTLFPGGEQSRRAQLLSKIREAARAGVDYIQLREKDLPVRKLEALAFEAAALIRETSPRTGKGERATRLLINSRTDVALACGADGVHLRSDDVSPKTVGEIWSQASTFARAQAPPAPVIAVSCHTIGDVAKAASAGATLAVLAPVFEKRDAPGAAVAGIEGLRQACLYRIPVMALGGVTLDNARHCVAAGAAGIAAIRLFQNHEVSDIVRQLRGRAGLLC